MQENILSKKLSLGLNFSTPSGGVTSPLLKGSMISTLSETTQPYKKIWTHFSQVKKIKWTFNVSHAPKVKEILKFWLIQNLNGMTTSKKFWIKPIKRTHQLYYNIDIGNCRSFYFSLISRFEHCSSVWRPITEMSNFEKLRKKGTKWKFGEENIVNTKLVSSDIKIDLVLLQKVMYVYSVNCTYFSF